MYKACARIFYGSVHNKIYFVKFTFLILKLTFYWFGLSYLKKMFSPDCMIHNSDDSDKKLIMSNYFNWPHEFDLGWFNL